MSEDISEDHPAIGRKTHSHDSLDPARAAALHVALGQSGPPPGPGAPLPPFFHQVYFWQVVPASGLGPDGHPALGGFLPDLGLPRRMWAGGRLEIRAPLHVGRPAERISEITTISRKAGRTGPLAFLTLRHEIRQGDRSCVVEEQDLVYRAAAKPDSARPDAVAAPEDRAPEPLAFDPTLLFRYSALTMNGHRIHYDADYARDHEGYDGLVVHGPLLAQILMLRAARDRPLAGFSFRSFRALTVTEPAVSNQDGNALWIRDAAGALVIRAEATW